MGFVENRLRGWGFHTVTFFGICVAACWTVDTLKLDVNSILTGGLSLQYCNVGESWPPAARGPEEDESIKV